MRRAVHGRQQSQSDLPRRLPSSAVSRGEGRVLSRAQAGTGGGVLVGSGVGGGGGRQRGGGGGGWGRDGVWGGRWRLGRAAARGGGAPHCRMCPAGPLGRPGRQGRGTPLPMTAPPSPPPQPGNEPSCVPTSSPGVPCSKTERRGARPRASARAPRRAPAHPLPPRGRGAAPAAEGAAPPAPAAPGALPGPRRPSERSKLRPKTTRPCHVRVGGGRGHFFTDPRRSAHAGGGMQRGA
jgi:hypothetical protein